MPEPNSQIVARLTRELRVLAQAHGRAELIQAVVGLGVPLAEARPVARAITGEDVGL